MMFNQPRFMRIMRILVVLFAFTMIVLAIMNWTRGAKKAKAATASAGAPAALATSANAAPASARAAAGTTPNVFILGIDGMDPQLLQKFVAEGRMPVFEKLMREGSYAPLGSSTPPQSPVAWSNFTTGQDPGGHGIFDFIHRDPNTYLPEFSMSSVEEPERVLALGSWQIPLSKGKVLLLRKGTAFWQILGDHGVPCTIFRIPSNFPPVHSKAKAVSEMGTPDLLGTYGTFSFFTDDPMFVGLDVSGGKIYPVTVDGNTVAAAITGPDNTLKKDKAPLTVPFAVHIDRENKAAKIEVDNNEFVLAVGDFSEWIEVSFDILGPIHSVKGICRFYLKSVEPYLGLYISPVNISPARPALPISEPADYATWLYKKIGFYYTQGMAEDTKALEWNVLSDGEFLRQTEIVFKERMKMLDTLLDTYTEDGGLMFFYISTLDQSTHMLWRNMDPNHPAHNAETELHADALENLYVKMDSVLAVVMKRIPASTTLIVMSDHGFAPYYKKFNLNTWLFQNRYIELKHPEDIEKHHIFADVLWRQTRSYALGINGLYINLRDREKNGIVRPGKEYEDLVKEITEKLLQVRDPESGQQVIGAVYRTSEIYHGAEASKAPDLIVGYKRGYRSSDQSALGNFARDVFELNMSKWSGDHCMATEEVPGVFLSNKKLAVSDPYLVDIASTILSIYSIQKTPEMVGRVILAP